jgi:hypothetical protein
VPAPRAERRGPNRAQNVARIAARTAAATPAAGAPHDQPAGKAKLAAAGDDTWEEF